MCEDAYLAGVFDGEGTIRLGLAGNKKGWGLGIIVVMVNKSVVLAFQHRFGGSLGVGSRSHTDKHGYVHRPTWSWHATGSKVEFLQAVLPYLIEKRAQIELALCYIAEFGEGAIGRLGRTPEQKARQQWYYEEFKRLKKVCEGCDDGV